MKVIDCHVHLNNYDELDNTNLHQRLDYLLKKMHENNVDQAIVISSYKTNNLRPSARKLIEVLENHDNLSVVCGFSINNHGVKDFQEYREWMKNGKLIGMKLYCGYEHYYPSDNRYQKIYDLCIEFDLPVMIHCGDTYSEKAKLKYAHPLNVDEVATDNPDLKIVICHLGNPWILDCQEVLYKNKNVYADVSGLFCGIPSNNYFKSIVTKIRELLNFGTDQHKLLFGTDWPISDIKSYFKLVDNLSLSKRNLELLLHRNTTKLFSI